MRLFDAASGETLQKVIVEQYDGEKDVVISVLPPRRTLVPYLHDETVILIDFYTQYLHFRPPDIETALPPLNRPVRIFTGLRLARRADSFPMKVDARGYPPKARGVCRAAVQEKSSLKVGGACWMRCNASYMCSKPPLLCSKPRSVRQG